MTNKDNGGPAFPVREDYSESQGRYVQYASDGISVRDYFAAKALGGMCADGSTSGTKAVDIVEECYMLADLMLLERNK